jgi:S-adenosylmethionine-diacylgycerolhomoserine-N-methlytransferase
MTPAYLRKGATHRETMTNYYALQSHFYDATRWAFLYGRKRIVKELNIQAGERVVEVGCGTGANFSPIQDKLQNSGELIGIDCSAAMLHKAQERVQRNRWTNVRLMDMEYGHQRVTSGQADAVLFSYSLSMIADWENALACAQSELRPGGRIGVLDFCRSEDSAKWFANWLAINHVHADRPSELQLRRLFDEQLHVRSNAWGAIWAFYLFVGTRQTVV